MMADLRAQLFEPADFGRFDVIVGMDEQNLARIEQHRPPGSETPVVLLTSWLAGEHEVPDPYYTGDFEGAFDLIERAVDALVEDPDRVL